MAGNKPQLLSGARGKIKIGTKDLAYVTDVSISYSVSVRAVHTFGALNARSVEPLQTSPVSVSIGRVVPVSKANGESDSKSLISEGIEQAISKMLTADDISITLEDRITGKTIAEIKNCRFAGSSLSLPASQLATQRIQMMGIYDAGTATDANSANTVDGPIGF